MKPFLHLALPIWALDQLTKWIVLRQIEPGDAIAVLPGFFNLVHVTNTGAAFGSLRGASGFLAALSIAVAIAIVAAAARGLFRDSWSAAGAALLLGGVLGNLTDRILHGHVVDFLDFHAAGWHWPAFNVADSAITAAAALFVGRAFWPERTPAPAEKAPPPNAE